MLSVLIMIKIVAIRRQPSAASRVDLLDFFGAPRRRLDSVFVQVRHSSLARLFELSPNFSIATAMDM